MSEVGNKCCELVIRECGVMRYEEALSLQQDLCQQRQEDRVSNTVLLVEHEPVITLGARKSENKLLVSEEELKGRGIEVAKVGRGGGTTAHNPGQLVVYPIVKLRSLGLGVNEYVRELESIGIEVIGMFGVECDRRKGYPGLWIGEQKIGSIGVQVKRGVTLHGMAINVNNDLSIFANIVPCGIEKVIITSLTKEAGKDISMTEVKEKVSSLCRSHLTLKRIKKEQQ